MTNKRLRAGRGQATRALSAGRFVWLQADNWVDALGRAWCARCGGLKHICCGDATNGFYCDDCCRHPYDYNGNEYEDLPIREWPRRSVT